MEKLLSIIIPTYNMEKLLDKCLSSLIISDKTLIDRLEVLVVIDGATDNSSKIAHTYQNKYPNTFRVIDKENGNYGSCINRGLKEAKGKYTKILDADDWFNVSSFHSYLQLLSDTNVDLILNDRTIWDENERMIERLTYDDILTERTRYSLSDLNHKGFERSQMHCVAYKTELLHRIGYVQTEKVSYTDQEWVFRPFASARSIEYFHLDLYQYLVGRPGQTMEASVLAKKFIELQTVVFSIMSTYENHNWDDAQKEYLMTFLRNMITSIYSNGIVSNLYADDQLRRFDESFRKNHSLLYDISQQWYTSANEFAYVKTWRESNRTRMYIFHPQICLLHIKISILKLFNRIRQSC